MIGAIEPGRTVGAVVVAVGDVVVVVAGPVGT